jgi:hypothetical protein
MNGIFRNWNPDDGDLCQGDVLLFRLPSGMAPDKKQPIPATGHQLILAAGEMTGHHHAIWMQPAMFRDDGLARGLEADFKPKATAGIAALYRDDGLVQALESSGHLTTRTLAIGLLTVDGAPVMLRHQEHGAIRIPVGNFYVGRQREFSVGEERQVAD